MERVCDFICFVSKKTGLGRPKTDPWPPGGPTVVVELAGCRAGVTPASSAISDGTVTISVWRPGYGLPAVMSGCVGVGRGGGGLLRQTVDTLSAGRVGIGQGGGGCRMHQNTRHRGPTKICFWRCFRLMRAAFLFVFFLTVATGWFVFGGCAWVSRCRGRVMLCCRLVCYQ